MTSEDGQPNNIVRWSLENGACDYLLKPIPMSVLKMVWKYMFFNNVSRVKNQRMSWTPDFHEKFEESVQKLGGAASMSLFPNLICMNLLFLHSSHLSAYVHFVVCF